MAISLSSISKTTRAQTPPRVVIHGEHGVGKSTLGASAYSPIFLPFEDGLAGIETSAFPVMTNYADALTAIDTLINEKHDFSTIVIDSLDWLEPLIWQHVCKLNGWQSIESPGYGKGYVEAGNTWRELLEKLDQLRLQRGMAVIGIAHSEIKHFDSPDSEAFDRYQIKLQKTAAGLVQEWADIIGFAQIETAIKKEQAGFGNSRARGIATGRRVLNVAGKPSCVAKNRYGMPDTIDLTWSALMEALAPPTQQPDTAAA